SPPHPANPTTKAAATPPTTSVRIHIRIRITVRACIRPPPQVVRPPPEASDNRNMASRRAGVHHQTREPRLGFRHCGYLGDRQDVGWGSCPHAHDIRREPEFANQADGGGGNRTRVHDRTKRASTSVFRDFDSPGRLPPDGPPLGLAPL